jgi:phosphoglycerate kinase
MAYTFLSAQGVAVGTSLVEAERIDDARRILAAAKDAGHPLLLPVDHVVAQKLEAGAEARVVREIPDGWMGLDIGPETANAYAAEARRAKTIFWNGPMGVFEIDAFAKGTEAVARAVADASASSVVGGGDSLAAVNRLGLASRITHCSTGGGASLEFVEGRALPGVVALENHP